MGFFSNLFSGGDKNQNVKKLNSPESSSKSLLRKNSTSDDEYEILPADTSDTEKPARIGLTVLGIGLADFCYGQHLLRWTKASRLRQL